MIGGGLNGRPTRRGFSRRLWLLSTKATLRIQGIRLTVPLNVPFDGLRTVLLQTSMLIRPLFKMVDVILLSGLFL